MTRGKRKSIERAARKQRKLDNMKRYFWRQDPPNIDTIGRLFGMSV
jgi:hypothetical protein